MPIRRAVRTRSRRRRGRAPGANARRSPWNAAPRPALARMTVLSPDVAGPRPLSRVLVGASVVAGLAITALLLAEARWLPALLMAVATLGAALAPVLRLPGVFVALIATLSVVNGASIVWDWYAAWSPFDEWAHLLNPLALVAPSMVWLHRARLVAARPGSVRFIGAATAYGFALAVGWEVIEAFIWVFPLSDTLSDVALGVLGSALAGWWSGRVIRAADGPPSP